MFKKKLGIIIPICIFVFAMLLCFYSMEIEKSNVQVFRIFENVAENKPESQDFDFSPLKKKPKHPVFPGIKGNELPKENAESCSDENCPYGECPDKNCPDGNCSDKDCPNGNCPNGNCSDGSAKSENCPDENCSDENCKDTKKCYWEMLRELNREYFQKVRTECMRISGEAETRKNEVLGEEYTKTIQTIEELAQKLTEIETNKKSELNAVLRDLEEKNKPIFEKISKDYFSERDALRNAFVKK